LYQGTRKKHTHTQENTDHRKYTKRNTKKHITKNTFCILILFKKYYSIAEYFKY